MDNAGSCSCRNYGAGFNSFSSQEENKRVEEITSINVQRNTLQPRSLDVERATKYSSVKHQRGLVHVMSESEYHSRSGFPYTVFVKAWTKYRWLILYARQNFNMTLSTSCVKLRTSLNYSLRFNLWFSNETDESGGPVCYRLPLALAMQQQLWSE